MADRDAFIIFTNTILHYDDLPSRLLKEYEEGNYPDWFAVFFATPFIDKNGNEKVLWESYWNKERLEKREKEIGSIAFAQEYRNKPLSEEDMIFKPHWFQYYDITEIWGKKLDIVMGVDPATGKKDGDYSAIVTVGKDMSTGLYYVLDVFGEKISDLKFANKIIEKYQIYKPRKIIFEAQIFQELYKNTVMREASKQGVHLPIKPVKSNAPKEVRIKLLEPLIENGLILFKENQTRLLKQLEEFPKGHDDLPDALAYVIREFEKKNDDTNSYVSRSYRRKTIV